MDDRERFTAMVEAEADKVFNLAWRLCGDRGRAADLVQEVFLHAWRHFGRFERRAADFTWLYRITCNLWKNSLRRKTFQSLPETGPAGDGHAAEIADRRPSPAEELRRREREEMVRAFLDELPPAEKMIIVLRDIEGHRYAEIARLLRCRPGTVKSRLARARAKLARRLAGRREMFTR